MKTSGNDLKVFCPMVMESNESAPFIHKEALDPRDVHLLSLLAPARKNDPPYRPTDPMSYGKRKEQRKVLRRKKI